MKELRADGSQRRLFVIRCRIFSLPACYDENTKDVLVYRTITLPVVPNECENWCVTSREDRRLTVFENRVLSRLFWPKRDEVTEKWRRLHKEELYDLYCSPDFIRVIRSRRMRWTGHVARMRDKRGAYNVLVGRSEGKRSLSRPRFRWKNNMKIDLQEE
jgi:hypothetical protein